MNREKWIIGMSRASKLKARTAIYGDLITVKHQRLNPERLENVRRRNSLRSLIADELERLTPWPNRMVRRLIASFRSPFDQGE